MIRVRQAIVVEGRYDKNKLAQLVDAPIFTTEGFGILKDKEKLSLLRQVAEKRGLILLTDPDGAGFVIRNYLSGALPRDRVLHAYVPDIFGKERRKSAPGKEGKLGVEGMDDAVLLKALRDCGAELDGEAVTPSADPVTRADFFELGLTGGRDSSAKRRLLLSALELPAHMSTTALLTAVNLLYSRQEFLTKCEAIL